MLIVCSNRNIMHSHFVVFFANNVILVCRNILRLQKFDRIIIKQLNFIAIFRNVVFQFFIVPTDCRVNSLMGYMIHFTKFIYGHSLPPFGTFYMYGTFIPVPYRYISFTYLFVSYLCT